MNSKLIGKKVYVKTSVDSPYAGEWGIIRHFDGADYHVGMWGDGTNAQVFARKELKVAK